MIIRRDRICKGNFEVNACRDLKDRDGTLLQIITRLTSENIVYKYYMIEPLPDIMHMYFEDLFEQLQSFSISAG